MGALGVDRDTKAAVLSELRRLLVERYVFPEVGEKAAAALADAAFDALEDGAAFAAAVTAEMQAVSRDRHLRLQHSAEPLPERPPEGDEARRQVLAQNGGFYRVERLPGNVGYLDQRALFAPEFAGDIAAAAMQVLANTQALIIDLRENGGGSPAMVALLCSYLLPPTSVHLNTIHWREGDRVQQFWTLPYVPGPRYLGKPAYVLTSRRTFSGAEELAYNLQALGRATIVGEVTAGGAHPTGSFRLHPHFLARIPGGRSVNPVTGTNWEGTGVQPDVAVAAGEALARAHGEALRQVLQADLPPALRQEAEQALRNLPQE